MWHFVKNVALGNVEEPQCEVIQQNEGYEERTYNGTKWVTVTREAPAKDPISKDMFMSLFHYLNGENDKGASIDMTKPVVTRVEPGTPNNTYKMAVYIPKQFQDDPPKPNNPDLSVEEWPVKHVLVRTFGGYAKDAATAIEKQSLAECLREAKVDVSTDGPFYQVAYDPPFKMFNRRNEIWFEKDAP